MKKKTQQANSKTNKQIKTYNKINSEIFDNFIDQILNKYLELNDKNNNSKTKTNIKYCPINCMSNLFINEDYKVFENSYKKVMKKINTDQRTQHNFIGTEFLIKKLMIEFFGIFKEILNKLWFNCNKFDIKIFKYFKKIVKKNNIGQSSESKIISKMNKLKETKFSFVTNMFLSKGSQNLTNNFSNIMKYINIIFFEVYDQEKGEKSKSNDLKIPKKSIPDSSTPDVIIFTFAL